MFDMDPTESDMEKGGGNEELPLDLSIKPRTNASSTTSDHQSHKPLPEPHKQEQKTEALYSRDDEDTGGQCCVPTQTRQGSCIDSGSSLHPSAHSGQSYLDSGFGLSSALHQHGIDMDSGHISTPFLNNRSRSSAPTQLPPGTNTTRNKAEAAETVCEVTAYTTIGMTGGVNTGTVIGKQELHEDRRFENICYETTQVINQHGSKEYVSTRAERTALKYLNQFGSIFIKGRSGSGKSRLGFRLMAKTQQERTPVLLTSPVQWDLIPKNNGKFMVFIDDIFGSSNLVQSQVEDWLRCFRKMSTSVESHHILLVISSRPEISAQCEARLKSFSIMSNLINIDDGTYKLKKGEKIKMLLKICGKIFNKTDLDRIAHMETKLGFPQCCKYYANSTTAKNKGIAFFENPYEYILQAVEAMQESDGMGYLALMLVLIRNGCLTDTDLYDSTLDLINRGQQFCRNLPQRVTLADIKHKLDSLCGVYIQRKGIAYEFQHQSIHDAVFILISREWPHLFIEMCQIRSLLQFVRIDQTDENIDTVIYIDSEYYHVLADRITELLLSVEPDCEAIISHPCLKDTEFARFLVDKWTAQECLSAIVKTKCKFLLYHSDGPGGVLPSRCQYLCSLMVMKKLTQLVLMVLSRGKLDSDILQEILRSAICTGNNELVKTVMSKGIIPDESFLDDLGKSGALHNDITDELFDYVFSSKAHGEMEDSSEQKHLDEIKKLRDLLPEAVIHENSRLVELVVDKLMQKDGDSSSVYSECLKKIFNGKICRGNMRADITVNTMRIIDKLLSTDCDIDADYLTFLAAGHSDARCLKIMLRRNVDIWKKHDRLYPYPYIFRSTYHDTSKTSVEMAVACGGNDCLNELLNHFRHINRVKSPRGRTKLENGQETDMTSYGDLEASSDMAMLLESHYLLHMAAFNGDVEKTAILIEGGISTNTQDNDGNTPLHKAVECNSLSCVQLLIESHSSVNVVNNFEKTPLMFIGYHEQNSADIVKALVQAGSNVNHVDGNGNSTLQIAVIKNVADSVRILVQSDCSVNYNNTIQPGRCLFPMIEHFSGTALYLACTYSDIEIVQCLCEHGADVNVTDEDRETVIHKAAGSRIDAMEKLQYLLDDGNITNIPLNDVERLGRTALFHAISTYDEEVVESLLDRDMDADVIDDNGSSALIYACSLEGESSEVIRVLLHKYDDVHINNSFSRTPLHFEKRAQLNMCDKQGKTALHYAAKENTENVKLLLKKGSDPQVQDKQGKTALHYASEMESDEGIRRLLGRNPEIASYVYDPPDRKFEAETRIGECINLLVEKGAGVQVRDSEGKTALHYAAQWNSHTTEILLENESDPHVKDEKGKIALHYAVQNDNIESMILLVEKGSDVNGQDKKCRTALHHAAKYGSCTIMKHILDKGADTSVQDNNSRSALHYAAERGSNKRVILLLEKGSNPSYRDKEGKTALHYAALRGKSASVKLLIEKGADPFIQDKMGRTALHYAAEADSSESLIFHLEKGVDRNVQDEEDKTALHCAAEEVCSSCVKLLLGTCTSGYASIQDKEGRTALHYAAAAEPDNSRVSDFRYTEMDMHSNVKILLEKGDDPSIRDKNMKTALHYAAGKRICPFIQPLLDCGIDAQGKDKYGRTPLHYASGSGNSDSVGLLLDHGVDPHVKDQDGRRGLHFAAMSGNVFSVQKLLDKGTDPNVQDKEGRTVLHYAAGTGHSGAMKCLLESGADSTVKDKAGRSAAHYSAATGILFLHESIADICAQDEQGKTALHYAARTDNDDTILLLQKEKDEFCKDRKIYVNLQPKRNESNENINLLLKKGADPRVTDRKGRTALHYVAMIGITDSWALEETNIKHLIGKGADPCVQDEDGMTALHYAAQMGKSDAVDSLSDKMSDLDLRDKDDRTALHHATKKLSIYTLLHCFQNDDCIDSIKLLLGKGTDPHLQDTFGKTALHYAAWNRSRESIKLLLEKGVAPSTGDNDGKTALHYAAEKRDCDTCTDFMLVKDIPACINLLLEKGAIPSLEDNDGKTALYYAEGRQYCDMSKHFIVMRGISACIKLLLEKGADANAKDNKGKTALHYAAENEFCGDIPLLMPQGANSSDRNA